MPRRPPFSPAGADFVPGGISNLSGFLNRWAAELLFPGWIVSTADALISVALMPQQKWKT